jgi:hypothetical protein
VKKLFLAFLLLAILPSVFAISVSVDKTYTPRETILVKFDGNFLNNPIIAENIQFYSGRQLVALEYNVAKLDNSYYLYAILPNIERNYTLVVKNVHYFEAGQEKMQTLQYNFSVTGNVSDFTVKPGFVITDTTFPLTLESNTNQLTVQLNYADFSTSIDLMPGIPKTIQVPLQFTQNVTLLKLKSQNTEYNIPVKSLTFARELKELSLDKQSYNLTIVRGSPYMLKIYLTNKGSEEIKDISISSNKNLNITPSKIPVLAPSTVAELNILMKPLESFTDTIEASASGVSVSSQIIVNVQIVPIQNLTPEEKQERSCLEIGGSICDSDQVCSGSTETTIEGTDACCIGTCKTRISFGKIISIVLIIAALGAGAYYIFRLTRKKPQKNVLKEVEQKYTGKFKEVHGNLTKT